MCSSPVLPAVFRALCVSCLMTYLPQSVLRRAGPGLCSVHRAQACLPGNVWITRRKITGTPLSCVCSFTDVPAQASVAQSFAFQLWPSSVPVRDRMLGVRTPQALSAGHHGRRLGDGCLCCDRAGPWATARLCPETAAMLAASPAGQAGRELGLVCTCVHPT